MWEFLLKNWLWIAMPVVGIAMIFLPMKMYMRFYRGDNTVILTTEMTFWFIPIKVKMVNPVTMMVWNMSQNKPWRKKPPQNLKTEEINWGRMYKRTILFTKVFMKIWEAANNFFRRFRQAIKMKDLKLYTEVGLDDVAHTAVSVGTVWGFIGSVIGQMSSIFDTKKLNPQIAVVPNYQASSLLVLDYSCIFEFRLGHIIIIMYQVLKSAADITLIIRRIMK